MAGFNSPSITFLNTWDKPERDYNSMLFRQALRAGYTRYVELYCGAFANVMVAVQSGWKPEQIETCDVWLYSAALGYAYSGMDHSLLNVNVDNEPVALTGDPSKDAAAIIMAQYRSRMEKNGSIEYIRELLDDLTYNGSGHSQHLIGKISENRNMLNGIRFMSADPMEYAKSIMDDPHTIVFANPPTYRGAYEKFFDTQGRVTWNEPEYEVFDAATDIPKLCDIFQGKNALLICQQQQTPYNSATKHPVYARRLGLDSVIYLNSNRPDEVKNLMGGNMITVKTSKQTQIPIPLIGQDDEITEKSDIRLLPLSDSGVQDAYLQVMRHRLSTVPSPLCLLVLIDGKVAGIIGYSVPTPYPGVKESLALLRQAFGAPHNKYRLTKLATMLSLRKSTLQMLATPKTVMRIDSTKKILTVEYTRYPEAKGLRGLMKLVRREKDKGTYKLHYETNWLKEIGTKAILAEFIRKENKRNGR